MSANLDSIGARQRVRVDTNTDVKDLRSDVLSDSRASNSCWLAWRQVMLASSAMWSTRECTRSCSRIALARF